MKVTSGCDFRNKRPIAIAIGKNHLVPLGDQIVDHGYNVWAFSDGFDARYIQAGDISYNQIQPKTLCLGSVHGRGRQKSSSL